ncbi:MAG: P1 family peptidase [Acidobacteriaceae bacterium]|nr:P1 family peptidase [Acidobacteriaceae bacterium]
MPSRSAAPLRLTLLLLVMATTASPQNRPRARDLGVPLDGTSGTLNAITDLSGIEVGHVTLNTENARTGVTVVWPRGKQSTAPAFGAWFSLNGNGEMTGTTWVEESGFVDGPIFLTNTHSVGTVRDAFIAWKVRNNIRPGTNSFPEGFWALPIVAETWDGVLNDINAFLIKPAHVEQAIQDSRGGPVPEGNVGGGTGMICFGFKGGIGTASRIAGNYTVAALVQCNCGSRKQLRIAGVPIGMELANVQMASLPPSLEDRGSIIIVVATDAPLLSHQLKRLARRASLGLARLGSTSGNGSGDIFIAFSTANAQAGQSNGVANVAMLPNDDVNPIFQATVEAVEESIVNALVAAEDMTGYNGRKVPALPHDALRDTLAKYNRLQPAAVR